MYVYIVCVYLYGGAGIWGIFKLGGGCSTSGVGRMGIHGVQQMDRGSRAF